MLKRYSLLNLFAIALPTALIVTDKALSMVSIISIITGFIIVMLLGLKGQITKHKDGIFAHLTSPGEVIKLTLTSIEMKVLWFGLSVFVGGAVALIYLSFL